MKPISIINKLNEDASVCSDEFKERLRNIFGDNIKDDTEYHGCVIGNTGICIGDTVSNYEGDIVPGLLFYPVESNALIPDIDKGGNLDIMAPDFIRSKDGTEYGDTYSFEGDLSDEEIKDICNELSSKIVHLKQGVRDSKGYGVIDESSSSSSKYKYITGANDYEDFGAEYIYNGMANTDVLNILEELKRYYDESLVAAEDAVHGSKSQREIGIYDSDIEMLKFCAEKTQEMIDKMYSAVE